MATYLLSLTATPLPLPDGVVGTKSWRESTTHLFMVTTAPLGVKFIPMQQGVCAMFESHLRPVMRGT